MKSMIRMKIRENSVVLSVLRYVRVCIFDEVITIRSFENENTTNKLYRFFFLVVGNFLL